MSRARSFSSASPVSRVGPVNVGAPGTAGRLLVVRPIEILSLDGTFVFPTSGRKGQGRPVRWRKRYAAVIDLPYELELVVGERAGVVLGIEAGRFELCPTGEPAGRHVVASGALLSKPGANRNGRTERRGFGLQGVVPVERDREAGDQYDDCDDEPDEHQDFRYADDREQ